MNASLDVRVRVSYSYAVQLARPSAWRAELGHLRRHIYILVPRTRRRSRTRPPGPTGGWNLAHRARGRSHLRSQGRDGTSIANVELGRFAYLALSSHLLVYGSVHGDTRGHDAPRPGAPPGGASTAREANGTSAQPARKPSVMMLETDDR